MVANAKLTCHTHGIVISRMQISIFLHSIMYVCNITQEKGSRKRWTSQASLSFTFSFKGQGWSQISISIKKVWKWWSSWKSSLLASCTDLILVFHSHGYHLSPPWCWLDLHRSQSQRDIQHISFLRLSLYVVWLLLICVLSVWAMSHVKAYLDFWPSSLIKRWNFPCYICTCSTMECTSNFKYQLSIYFYPTVEKLQLWAILVIGLNMWLL